MKEKKQKKEPEASAVKKKYSWTASNKEDNIFNTIKVNEMALHIE